MRTPRAPRVKVEVHDDLIRDSVNRDSTHCMIAEAVKAAYPDATNVSVDVQTIRFTNRKKGFRYTYLTPRIAQVPLIKFDQGLLPSAFAFMLRNGQVTRAGSSKRRSSEGAKTPQGMAGTKNLRKAQSVSPAIAAQLRKARLSTSEKISGNVPDRIGGKTPPLQPTKDDPKTPFSRRRAFGLRGLEL